MSQNRYAAAQENDIEEFSLQNDSPDWSPKSMRLKLCSIAICKSKNRQSRAVVEMLVSYSVVSSMLNIFHCVCFAYVIIHRLFLIGCSALEGVYDCKRQRARTDITN